MMRPSKPGCKSPTVTPMSKRQVKHNGSGLGVVVVLLGMMCVHMETQVLIRKWLR
jgi:hypothetical protein